MDPAATFRRDVLAQTIGTLIAAGILGFFTLLAQVLGSLSLPWAFAVVSPFVGAAAGLVGAYVSFVLPRLQEPEQH